MNKHVMGFVCFVKDWELGNKTLGKLHNYLASDF